MFWSKKCPFLSREAWTLSSLDLTAAGKALCLEYWADCGLWLEEFWKGLTWISSSIFLKDLICLLALSATKLSILTQNKWSHTPMNRLESFWDGWSLTTSNRERKDLIHSTIGATCYPVGKNRELLWPDFSITSLFSPSWTSARARWAWT